MEANVEGEPKRATEDARTDPRPAGMPADWGLTPLGLLMELAGLLLLVFGGVVLTLGVLLALRDGGVTWLIALLGLSAIVRSDLHRRAGRALVYGHPSGAMRPLEHYLGFSFAHSLLAPFLLMPTWAGSSSMWAPSFLLALVLVAWPATIALFARRTPFWRSGAETIRIPAAEDNGYESLAVLMMILGSLGALFVAGMALGLLNLGIGGHLVVALPVLALLAYRSALHLRTSTQGLRGVGGVEFEDRGMRYSNTAIVIAFAAAAATFFASLVPARGGPFIIFGALAVFWMLFVWPRIVAQFLQTRSYAHLVEGEGGPLSRAPDLGLSALGWVLLGFGVTSLAADFAGLVGAAGAGGEFLSALWLGTSGGMPLQLAVLAAGAAQVWAGVEIVRMTHRLRDAVLVYGTLGILAALWVGWGQLQLLSELGPRALTSRGAEDAASALLQVVPALILPVAALILTKRKQAPTARVVTAAPRRTDEP